PLERGDEVLTTTQDYPRMLTAWHQRERRDGIVVREISFPVPPPSQDDLAERVERAISAKTKVIHVCHITNLTGQIFPIKKIVERARARGIEVIVDGAHAYAHFPFTRDELDCDYYGTSLHKWLLAPHGTGFLYVRKSKIDKIYPLMAAPPELNGNIRKFEEIGTHPAANHNAIAEALSFHEGIGAERKASRLRFLFQRWAKRLDKLPRVKILTPYDPERPPTPASDLHRQRDHERPGRGHGREMGNVLERRDIRREQRLVRVERGRLPVVDARRVDADGADLASHEPAGRIGMDAREVELRHRRHACFRGAEVARPVGPATPPPRAEQHDRSFRNPAVRLLPPFQIAGRDAVVALCLSLPAHVDHVRGADELSDGNLVGGVLPFREMDGRVEVGTAVLGSGEVVGGVVVPCGSALRRHYLEPERLRRRP